MSDKPDRVFKGVWIPKEIWDACDLTWMEKCLLAEINALDDGSGCFASNEYLAEKFDSSSASMANIISKLRALGFLETISFNGRQRRIQVKADLTQRLMLDSLPDERCFNPVVNSHIEERKEERIDTDALSVGEGFCMFWNEYPRHEGRFPASKSYRKYHRFLPEMLVAIRKMKKTEAWMKDGGQFIPHAATWLNERRWEDEIKEIESPKKGPPEGNGGAYWAKSRI